MKYRYSITLACLLLFYTALTAQTKSNVHIVTDSRNHLPGFSSFHFTVNGISYKLKAGQCLDLSLTTDSIHVLVEDKRWVKKATDDLHVAASENINIWVRVQWTGNYKNPHYGAEVICQSCYDELKKKCR
jgi:hypothetical protein